VAGPERAIPLQISSNVTAYGSAVSDDPTRRNASSDSSAMMEEERVVLCTDMEIRPISGSRARESTGGT
jgi:hypothetical protein